MNNRFVLIRTILVMAGAAGLWMSSSAPFTRASSTSGSFPIHAPVGFLQQEDLLPPVALDDSFETDEDTLLTVDAPGVLGNDLDINGDPMTAGLVDGPANGVLTLNDDGSFSYEPAPDFDGNDQFTYVANDGTGDSNLATVTLTIHPVNDPPQVEDDAAETEQGAEVSIDVLANDQDPEENLDPGTVNVSAGPDHGSATVHSDTGRVTYAPNPDYAGPDDFIYEVCDTGEACNSGNVSVNVIQVNSPPLSDDDSETTQEDTPVEIDVLSNDTDLDNNLDPGSLAVIAGPEHGSTSVNSGNGIITYTPDLNYNGVDNFTYEVCDSEAQCDSANVSVNVTAVNDPPDVNDDTADTPENTAVTINVLSNDSDIDGSLDPASVSVTAGPAHGSTSVIPANGRITYTPEAGYNGADSFTYQVCDNGSSCSTAGVSMDVTRVNDAPSVANDSSTTQEDQPKTVDVLDNDTDPDGSLDPSSVTVIVSPDHGTASANPSNGWITYDPNPNYNGPDSFTYRVCDNEDACDSANVSITVEPVADPPNALDDSASTAEDTAKIINVLANDSDPDGTGDLDPGSVQVTDEPAHGSTAVNPSTGAITYIPDLDYNGPDSFTYQVCDLQPVCDTADVSLTVTSVNDQPEAVDDNYGLQEDEILIVDAPGVLSNDSDVEPAGLSAVLDSGPVHGELHLNGDGSFTYTSDANYNGSDSFTYHASDGDKQSESATVHLTIQPRNDSPEATDDQASTPEDTQKSINVIANDTDADGNLVPGSVTITNQADHGMAVVNGTTGVVSYTPSLNYNGPDSFDYEVCDTTELCATASVSITVTPVNDSPNARNDSTSTPEDTAKIIHVLNNDSDPDGDLDPGSVQVTDAPAHGSTQVNHSNGDITYTPQLNFNGLDSFDYRVCDSQSVCDTARVTINVGGDNDAPTPVDDSTTTPEDTAKVINVLSNDTDPDGAGDLDPGSVQVTDGPAHGSTAVNTSTGAITYTPDLNYNGPDSLVYQVCDLENACDTATVAINVTPVNDPPLATGDSYFFNQDEVLNIEAPGVLENDNDPDHASFAAVLDAQTQHGTLVLNSNGSFTYTPNAGYTGQDSFTYHASDGSLSSAAVTVELTIYDIVPPTLEWVSPISQGGRVDVGGEIVSLEVNVSDNVAIDRVRFYRWDAVNERYVDIANIDSSPYQVNLDTSALNDGWNQIFARAFDQAGNASGQDQFIWLYGDYTPRLYLPLIARH